jgi:prepilin-type N-terminal cleavage/methylation domain-containing protein
MSMIQKLEFRRQSTHRARGFTLIELVLVIGIIGLLLGAVLTPLATQVQQRKVKEAENGLADIREALIGYALAKGRLPCPDNDDPPDGVGNPVSGGPCNDPGGGDPLEGFLPFGELGVTPVDGWGRRYLYRVTSEYTYATVPGSVPAVDQLDLGDAGDITIKDRASDKSEIVLASTAAAVVVSLGRNGYGGRDLDNNTLVAPTGTDELENTNFDATFVKRGHSPEASPCSDTPGASAFCEYDDLVIWIPDSLLKGRLVAANQLP